MSFFENTRKPVGLGGKIMVAMMNLGHSPVARWGLQFLNAAPDARVLDCGCGGGANMKRLLKKCPQGIVKGIDYSPVSVEKSKKVNETAIAEGRCTVLQGSVADMMFADNWFDAVTAFETVYFWPDLPRFFREVYRVLKPGGTFLICNESNGDTDKDKKWTEIIGGMTIYKDVELSARGKMACRKYLGNELASGSCLAALYAHTGSFSSYKVEHTGYSALRREYGHFSGDSRREGDKTAPDCIGGSYLCLRCRQRRDRFCGTGSAAYGTKADRRQTPRPHACLHAAGGAVVAFGRHAGTVCLSAEGDPGWYRDLRAFGSVFSVPAPQVFLREDVYAFTYAGKGFVCRI